MTDADIRKVLEEELNNIAPEIDMVEVDPNADLREAMDIDSMDFLNFITALHQRLNIDIPELDYPKLFTLKKSVAYVKTKLGPGKA